MSRHFCAFGLAVLLSAGVLAPLAARPWATGGQERVAPTAARTPSATAPGDAGPQQPADRTAALQALVEAGGRSIVLEAGVHPISRTILVDLDRVGPVSISGGGAARVVMRGPGPAFRFVGTHRGTADPNSVEANVWLRQRMPSIDGLEIVGEHPDADGIEASGTMQLTLTRLAIRGTRHAIHLVDRNRNVTIADCHVYENRGAGIFLDNVNLHQTNVSGCHISYNGGGGIVVRGGNVRNLQVCGCDIEANMSEAGPPTANLLLDSSGGDYGVAEVAISGCTIQHTQKTAGSANIRYLGEDARHRRWGNLVITGNVLSDARINVDIRKARGVSIVGNTFWAGADRHLQALQSSHVVVGPNLMDRNPGYASEGDTDDGVLLADCCDCTLSGLHLSGVRRAEAGLVLDKCRRISVTGCTILDCQKAGILLRDCHQCRVANCFVSNDLPNEEPFEAIGQVGGAGNRVEP